MNQSKYRRYLISFFGFFMFCLIVVMVLVIGVDPFFQYHKPIDGVCYIIDNQLSQNPGMAKNFDYDSVILGSSMTVNFDTNIFAKTMGLQTIKLSYNAAYPQDIANIMEIVQNSHNEVKKVFLGIDVFTYKEKPGITAYPIPKHLYDDNLINDVSYIFNMDVLMDYVLEPQIKRTSTPLNEVYWSWRYSTYGRETIQTNFIAPEEIAQMLPANTYESNVRGGLEQCIVPYIESMPDTEFTVFFPPYSVLYWYARLGDGSLEAELQAERQIVESLLSYPNVRIFYFQNDFEMITNLDNYCDYTHYTHDINDYMTRCFADGTSELTKDNFEAVFEEMKSYMAGFEFEEFWNQKESLDKTKNVGL